MTPSADPFLGRTPLPTDDFRQLVKQQGLSTIELVSFWIREPLQQLYYAAAASPNAFKMALAHVTNHVQALFLALKRSDARAWTGTSNHSFPIEYLRASKDNRTSALAWAYFTHASTILSTFWNIAPERQETIHRTYAQRDRDKCPTRVEPPLRECSGSTKISLSPSTQM